jgi:hypothetical protein
MSKNLEMSIFDSDDNFELNIEDNLPADFFVDNDADDINDDDSSNDYGEDDSLDDDTNLNDGDSDDDSQEDVVKKDALENEGGEDDDSDSPNIFSPFATVLKEQGLLPSLSSDSKIESIEDLTTAFKSEIDNQVKNYLVEKIGEDGVNALEKGITLAEYQQYKNGVDTLNNIDSESLSTNIELSKNIILQDYISQGLSEEKAYRFLQKTIELGDDAIIEDAKQSLESLKHIQEIKLEKAKESRQAEMIAEQKAQEKIDNDLKNSIFNSNEIIQGLTMTKAMKENVYKSITNIVSKSPDGIAENKLMRHRREDPIEFDKKLYYLYELTNQFKDFSTLVSKSKTKATSEFEKILRSNKSQIQNGLPSFANDPDSYGGIGDEIVFD